MKLSKYNFFYPKENQCIVFNTFSNSISILSSKEFYELQDLRCLDNETIKKYQNLGIIIEDEMDELAIMRFDNQYFIANSECHIRILTTTACNARCTYCYEQGVQVLTMNKDTIEKVTSFIGSVAPVDKSIHIEWFGGEPLLNIEAIQEICKKLAIMGYSFESTIVTNGILLDSEKISILKNVCNLSKAQITLDGLADVYGAVKGVSPACFDKVIDNITLLAAHEITVHVRMNYSDNKSDLVLLIKYLASTIGFQKRIFYYIHPIFDDCEYVSATIMENVLELDDLLVAMGLMKKSDLYNFAYRQTRCFAITQNGYTIAPDGKIYNCSHVMNARGLVGSVDSYSPYNMNRIRFISQDISDRCIECVLYPLCKGGCRAAELKEAKLNQCTIYKSCIEAVLDRLLAMNVVEKGGV